MVSSTYIGYAQTIMNYQWDYFWNINLSALTATDGTTTVNIGSSVFLSYAGAGFAFIMSLLGAYDNAGKTLVYVEDSMDDWLKRYSAGKYDQILDLAKESELMQNFLNEFTWDLILYTSASFFHSCLLLAGGTFAAFWILLKI